MAISILFQIIIWYCGRTWCVTCVVPWERIICHDMVLFCFPPQVMLKLYLSFLFNIAAPQNRIKKVSFHAVSYSSLLVMISSSLLLKPGPGSWTLDPDPEKPGPWKTWEATGNGKMIRIPHIITYQHENLLRRDL